MTLKHCKSTRSCFELKGKANNMSKDLVQGSRKRILLTSWVAFCLCMLSFAARAQVDQGAVTGTVVDQQGAVVPNAKVTVTDLGTALKLETKTDQRGVYVFSPLKIGHYSINVSAPGFSATNVTDFQLQVNQRPGLNITLQVGATTETV